MLLTIDEINRVGLSEYENRYNPQTYYDEFFDVMDIPEKGKQARKYLAMDFEDALNVILYYIFVGMDSGTVDRNRTLQVAKNEIEKILPDDIPYFELYALLFSRLFVDTTLKHLHEGYYFSDDRVMDVSANESLSVMGYLDLKQAQENGKKFKTWHTEQDNRVRPSHIVMDGVTIPIEDMFEVGSVLMRFPHDPDVMEDAPEEIINCRCSLSFS